MSTFNLLFLRKYDGKIMPSGNSILYQACVKPAGYSYTQLFVQVSVKVQNAPGSAVWDLVKTEKLVMQADGTFSYDIASLCDPYLEYFVPPPDLDNLVDCTKQIRNFSITLDLYWESFNNAKIDTITDTVRVLKAGTAYEYFLPETGTLLYGNEEKFLFASEPDETTGLLKETVFEDDRFFLFFLIPANGQQYFIEYFMNWAGYNGGDAQFYDTLHLPIASQAEAKVYCMPGGFLQNNMQAAVPAGVIVKEYWFDIFFYDEFNVKQRRNFSPYPVFTLEKRKFYNAKKLLYRNSMGSLMPLAIKGQIDNEALYEKQTLANRPLHWLNHLNVTKKLHQTRGREDFKCKGETGLITQFEANRLRDLFLSDEVYEYTEGRLVPVIINTTNVKYYSNLDSLFNISLEWQQAFRNTHWSKAEVAGNSCPAMLFFDWYHVYNNTLQIIFSLPVGYNFFRVNVLFPGEDTQYFYVEGNTGTATITFVRPPSAGDGPVSVMVNANVMCSRYNKVPSYGPYFETAAKEIGAAAPLFAGADTFNIAAGVSVATLLAGSVLDNDFDPNGGAITAVPLDNEPTAEGGIVSIDAQGHVTYTPPADFTGTDSIAYEITNGTDIATGQIFFVIGGTGTNTNTIWAGVSHEELTFQGFNSYYNKHYIALWATPGMQLISGTVSVNYKKTIETYIFNNAGNPVLNSTEEAELTIDFVNEQKKLLYTGNLEELIVSVFEPTIKKVTSFTVLPGNGYTAM